MIELSIVVGLVIVTSAACSVLEAVLYPVPPGPINALDRSGRASGRIPRRLRGEVDRPIAAILSPNTPPTTGGPAQGDQPGRLYIFEDVFVAAQSCTMRVEE